MSVYEPLVVCVLATCPFPTSHCKLKHQSFSVGSDVLGPAYNFRSVQSVHEDESSQVLSEFGRDWLGIDMVCACMEVSRVLE